jgi:predicted cytidylate kinase
MIIALGGKAGSGKSTVAKLLAKKLNYRHYSMGDFQREIAKQRNLSIFELSKLEEKDPSIDKEVDNLQTSLGNKDNFVIDSRLGFHFIPKAKKIFLDADFEVRARRILNDKARKENNKNLEKAKENIKQREASEIARYKKYYNLNPYNKKNFDNIIDTSNSNPEEIVNNILSSLNIN